MCRLEFPIKTFEFPCHPSLSAVPPGHYNNNNNNNNNNSNNLFPFFQGLTKSLIDIPTTFENFSDPSQKEISAAVGYVIGFLLGKLPRFADNKIWVVRPIPLNGSLIENPCLF